MQRLIALFRLGLPSAIYLKYLTSPLHITRRTVLQKVRDHPHMGLSQLAGTGFQVLFHSPPGVLFTFPSRYCFTIGHQVVFSLTGWSPHVQTRFHVSRPTLDTVSLPPLSNTWLSHPLAGLSMPFF